MPKQRISKRDKAFEIYKRHQGNIQLREIASVLIMMCDAEKKFSGQKYVIEILIYRE